MSTTSSRTPHFTIEILSTFVSNVSSKRHLLSAINIVSTRSSIFNMRKHLSGIETATGRIFQFGSCTCSLVHGTTRAKGQAERGQKVGMVGRVRKVERSLRRFPGWSVAMPWAPTHPRAPSLDWNTNMTSKWWTNLNHPPQWSMQYSLLVSYCFRAFLMCCTYRVNFPHLFEWGVISQCPRPNDRQIVRKINCVLIYWFD